MLCTQLRMNSCIMAVNDDSNFKHSLRSQCIMIWSVCSFPICTQFHPHLLTFSTQTHLLLINAELVCRKMFSSIFNLRYDHQYSAPKWYITHTRPPCSPCTHVLTEKKLSLSASGHFHSCLPVVFSLVICHIYFRFLSGSRCPDICPLIQSLEKIHPGTQPFFFYYPPPSPPCTLLHRNI